jgi:hypothetical protein
VGESRGADWRMEECGSDELWCGMRLFTHLRFVLLPLLGAVATGSANPVVVEDDFSSGDRGWQAFFVDHPPGVESAWGMSAGLRPLPSELGRAGSGFMITGNNHSDDLGMVLKKQLGPADGIQAGQTYWLDFEIQVASNAPSGAVGVGGSPGDSVYLKAGGSVTEPDRVLHPEDNHLRPTINVGFQSVGGPAATVSGVIANGRDAGAPAQFVALSRTHRHGFPVRADANGRLWLLVMTDSAFEGPTTLYYLRIRTTLTPVVLGDGSGIVNLSTRAVVYPGDGALIAGFVAEGPGSGGLVVRGVGPFLKEFGVDDALADPRIEVVRGNGVQVAGNDDWGAAPNLHALRMAMGAAGAFPLFAGSKDAAVLVNGLAGAHTAIMRGSGEATGVGLVEVYAVPSSGRSTRLVNLSARARAGEGEAGIFAGLVIQGPHPERVLIRAIGPGLAAHGVSDPAVDPILTLYRDDDIIATNLAWGAINSAAEVESATTSAGAFPLANGSRDAALVVTLEPGAYTLTVEEAQAASIRTALVEVYWIP